MRTDVQTITPEKATEFISMNKLNRPHNKEHSRALARAMQRGEWEKNGDTICVSKTGRLLDGQHRLWAIVYSGMPQECIVVSNLDDKCFDTIDRGMNRNIGQILAINGEKNAKHLANACGMGVLYEETGDPFYRNSLFKPTAKQVEEFLRMNPSMRDATNKHSANRWTKKYIRVGTAAFCEHIFSKVDPDACEKFFDELTSGVVSYRQSPVLLLRDRMMDSKANGIKFSSKEIAAYTFKAFSDFRRGKELKLLKIYESNKSNWFDIKKL